MKQKKFNIKVILCFIGIILLGYGYKFLSRKIGLNIPCFFYEMTNLYCPGCGITRLLFSLMNLELYQAFRYNPLIFIFLPMVVFYLGDYCIKLIVFRRDFLYKKVNSKVWIVLLIIAILFGVLRNIPGFEVLRPTKIM